MLRFPDAGHAVEAALDLVRVLNTDGLPAHAEVHSGPSIKRDLDLFGRTVNLASQIADVAGPGEVLVSEAVVKEVHDAAKRHQLAGTAILKGVPEPVRLFRATSQ
jgi:class 3 adenylate cyclase